MSLPVNQISSIIGAGGGDYLTLTAWEADLDDAAFDQDYISEITGQTADTAAVYFSGINTTSAFKAIIRPASGQEPDGTDNAGAVMQHLINIQESTNVANINISIEFNAGAVVIQSLRADSEINIIKSVFRDCTSGCVGIDVQTGCLGTVNIGNCLFRNFAYVPIWQKSSSATVRLINTTLYGNNYGVYWSKAFSEVKNVVSMGNTQADYKTTITNTTYCAAEDTSLPTATGNIEGLTIANQFTDAASDDFTVKDASADIYHSGINISYSWFPATDLVGTTWNDPPSMGCFEFIEFVGSSTNLDCAWKICKDETINTSWKLFDIEDELASWKIKNELYVGSTWKILKPWVINSSWKILADTHKDIVYKILISDSLPSEWKIFKRLSSGTEWLIANKLTQDTVWKLLIKEDFETVWRILTAGEIVQDITWKILSEITQDISWDVLTGEYQNTSFKILNSTSNPASWKILTKDELSFIWKVFLIEYKELLWQILTTGELQQNIEWKIKKLSDKITGWKIQVAGSINAAWKIINEDTYSISWNVLRLSDKDLAYRIFSELEQDTSWVIGESESIVPDAVYEFFQLKRNFIFNANTRTLIFYQKER